MDNHEVKGTVKEWAGKAEKTYGEVRDELKNTVEDAADEPMTTDARSWGEALDDTMDVVRRNPLQATGIALATGVFLGALLAYWSRD